MAVLACRNTDTGDVHVRHGAFPRAPYDAVVGAVAGDDAERRYQGLLDLAAFDGAAVRATLRRWMRSEDLLARNAAARALLELGEASATEALIANLGPGVPGPVVRDAAHHLETVYERSERIEPQLGLEHRRAVQARWWTFWAQHPDGRLHARPTPGRDWLDWRDERRRELLARARDPGAHADVATFHALLREALDSVLEEDLLAVRRACTVWLERRPEDADVVLAAARATCALGDPEGALQLLVEAPSSNDPRFVLERAVLERALGRPEDAVRTLDSLSPSMRDGTWYVEHAWTALARGRRAEAIASFRQAEDLAPQEWMRHRLWRERLEGAR